MLIAQARVENLTLRVNDYGQLPEHRSADVADVARSGDRQITVRRTSSPAFSRIGCADCFPHRPVIFRTDVGSRQPRAG